MAIWQMTDKYYLLLKEKFKLEKKRDEILSRLLQLILDWEMLGGSERKRLLEEYKNIIEVIKSPRKIHQESFPTIEEGQQIEEHIDKWENDWSDISSQFKNNPNLVKSWTEKGFNKLETKKWNDIGLKPTESEFAQFLRDIKWIMSTKEILNEGSVKELKEEFQEYKKLHTKIETPLERYELQR